MGNKMADVPPAADHTTEAPPPALAAEAPPAEAPPEEAPPAEAPPPALAAAAPPADAPPAEALPWLGAAKRKEAPPAEADGTADPADGSGKRLRSQVEVNRDWWRYEDPDRWRDDDDDGWRWSVPPGEYDDWRFLEIGEYLCYMYGYRA